MTTRPAPLDPAFANLTAMIADLGEGFIPQRHNLNELMQDTMDALDASANQYRARTRMSA